MDNKPDAADDVKSTDSGAANDAGNKLPQQMGDTKAPGYKAADASNEVAAIERQDKIDALRTKEDFLEQYDPPKKSLMRRGARSLLHFIGWMLLIVLLTGGGAAAGWYFWLRKEPMATQSTSPPPPAAASTQTADEEAPVETYNSTVFQLQFDHPEGWKVTEGTDNKIVAVSPATQLKSMTGSSQTGQIVFTVQHKQVSLPDFKEGNALAARESEKIDYKKPSQVQRASTYVSFLDYAPAAGKAIDAIYVTGDSGYQASQYIPQEDIVKSDPLIMIMFRKCSDAQCSAAGDAMPVMASAWDDTKFSGPLKTMLQSIVVQ